MIVLVALGIALGGAAPLFIARLLGERALRREDPLPISPASPDPLPVPDWVSNADVKDSLLRFDVPWSEVELDDPIAEEFDSLADRLELIMRRATPAQRRMILENARYMTRLWEALVASPPEVKS